MTEDTQRHLNDNIIRIKARFALLYFLGERNALTCPVKAEETYRPTAELLGLSYREQTITIQEKNGIGGDCPWWPNQVQWARQKLKEVSALTSSRHGYWQLSDKGQQQYELLKQSYKESGLSFEDYAEYYVREKRQKP